jgi:hypothetical protein
VHSHRHEDAPTGPVRRLSQRMKTLGPDCPTRSSFGAPGSDATSCNGLHQNAPSMATASAASRAVAPATAPVEGRPGCTETARSPTHGVSWSKRNSRSLVSAADTQAAATGPRAAGQRRRPNFDNADCAPRNGTTCPAPFHLRVGANGPRPSRVAAFRSVECLRHAKQWPEGRA